mgnify:CR=1 FL=1
MEGPGPCLGTRSAVHLELTVRVARDLDLLRATWPGGSITGAPKVRAMEIIAELEDRKSVV